MVNYKCIYCKKDFNKKSNFLVHVSSCEIKFNKAIENYRKYNKDSLLQEYIDIKKRKYIKDKIDYQCDKCNKIYISYNGLKSHIFSKVCTEKKLDICDKLRQKYNIINKTSAKTFANQSANNPLDNTININLTAQVTPLEKYKKKTIPLSLKRVVWDYWIGEDIGRTKCLCCNVTQISQMNFHCGHVVAEINGGDLEPQNLKPICQSCNSSMGTTNMDEFIKKYGLDQNKNVINDV
jgi:hypothetical protein